jgi:hypothetical protein
MNSHEENNKDVKNVLREDMPEYQTREALEEARLKEAVGRTASEKFRFLMTLMKMNNQMRKATIHYK